MTRFQIFRLVRRVGRTSTKDQIIRRRHFLHDAVVCSRRVLLNPSLETKGDYGALSYGKLEIAFKPVVQVESRYDDCKPE